MPEISLTASTNFLLLYVDSPKVSGAFHADLLGLTPVETTPTFDLFAITPGALVASAGIPTLVL
jgi:hypothetical protein